MRDCFGERFQQRSITLVWRHGLFLLEVGGAQRDGSGFGGRAGPNHGFLYIVGIPLVVLPAVNVLGLVLARDRLVCCQKALHETDVGPRGAASRRLATSRNGSRLFSPLPRRLIA